jgi:putative FmdB family regulatory protein
VPIYEFRCDSCDATHEVIVLAGESAPEACPDCGGALKRLWSRLGVSLQGWGFARTDTLLPDSPKRKPFRQIRDKASELFD